jgi:hypothetical protein
MLVTTSGFSSSLILVTLMKEALRPPEPSFLTRATRRNVREDAILQIIQRSFRIGTTHCSVLWLLIKAKAVPSSPIPITLMMEVLRSSDTSLLTRATRRNTPEDGILHSHCCEILKSYIALTGWAL